MKTIICHLAIFATCLAPFHSRAASPSALANPGFEDIQILPSDDHHALVPGWRHYGPNSGDGSYWNRNSHNLGVFAEAYVLDGSSGPPWQPSNVGIPPAYPPLDGRFSIALVSSFPADALITDPQWGYSQYTGNRTGDSLFLGRAGIAQSIGLPADITELTCYYADFSSSYWTGGSLVLSFNNQALGYTLEPTIGPNGPTTLLRADLTPVAGQYGELRIGIEGRGFFIVDDIVVVPEASTVAGALLLGITAAGILTRGRRRAHKTPRPALAGDDSSPPARATPCP